MLLMMKKTMNQAGNNVEDNEDDNDKLGAVDSHDYDDKMIIRESTYQEQCIDID